MTGPAFQAPQDMEREESQTASQRCARQRWKAALTEVQQIRVTKLREKQADAARSAERKRDLSQRFEADIERNIGGKPLAEVISYFGASSYKRLLVKFHPDRTCHNASFEESVRREVIFKYVQQIHGEDSCRGGAEEERDADGAARRREAKAYARAWREEAAAKAEAAKAAEEAASAVPALAVLRVATFATAHGSKNADSGPLGYYCDHPAGQYCGKPRYRKIVEAPPSWAPWSAEVVAQREENAAQIYWTGTFWCIGHPAGHAGEAGLACSYMACDASNQPPSDGWDQVDVRAPQDVLVQWL